MLRFRINFHIIKIITNNSIPALAHKQLSKYGKVINFETKGIAYPAISCHPDVFICECDKQLIIAPNTPDEFIVSLVNNNVSFIKGVNNVGNNYPETAFYNAVVTENYLIHNLKITDNIIIDVCSHKKSIHVKQAYTRCNLLPLKNNSFITSDIGIHKTLSSEKLNVLFVDPDGILLPGFKHGFFGGVCGISNDHVYILGILNKFQDGEITSAFLKDLGYQIIELYDGPLYDGGSLMFVD